MTLSALEAAVVSAGRVLWASPFGKDLRAFHARPPGGMPPSVFDIEVNRRPYMQTAIAVTSLASRTGQPFGTPSNHGDYLEFIGRATRALAAFADKFWGAIPADIRAQFADEDDLPASPSTSSYFGGLRSAHPPSFRSVEALSLGLREASALASVWRSAHRTKTYTDALTAASTIRSDTKLRAALRLSRNRLAEALPPSLPEVATEESRRVRALLEALYDDRRDQAVQAGVRLRSYHRLLQRSVWSLVSFAAGHMEPQPVDWQIGRVLIKRSRQTMEAHFTLTDPRFLVWSHPTDSFVVQAGTPADGLYTSVGSSFQMRRQATTLVIHGERLRELEG